MGERRLARPAAPDDRHRAARLDRQRDVPQDVGARLVGEADVLGLDAAAQRVDRLARAGLLLGRRVEHVVDALHVRAEQLRLQAGADERRQRREQAGRQRAHREHRAERQLAVEHERRADAEDEQRRARAQRAEHRVDARAQPPARERRVDLVDEQVRPALDGAVLGAERLERLDPRQHLDEVGLRARLRLQRLAHQAAVARLRDEQRRHLEHPEAGDDDRHERALQRDHDEVERDERAVEHGRHRGRRQDLADRRVAVEAHHQVAGAAPQEERRRQADEVADEAGRDLEVEVRAQVERAGARARTTPGSGRRSSRRARGRGRAAGRGRRRGRRGRRRRRSSPGPRARGSG